MKRLGTWLLPISLIAGWASFQAPQWVEQAYARSLYPVVARSFALVNRAPFSVAEMVVAILSQNPRALASRIELRPFRPPKRS